MLYSGIDLEWWNTTFYGYSCVSLSYQYLFLSSLVTKSCGHSSDSPLYQMPFIYHINSTHYDPSTQTGSYHLQVQLTSGLSYVLYLFDSTGLTNGLIGYSNTITVSGYDQTSCLITASQNQTTLDFSFQSEEGGNIQQCMNGMELVISKGGTGP